MCGGIVTKSKPDVIRFSSKQVVLIEHLLMHLGRIMSYAILGAVAGELGTILWWQDVLPIQRGLFFVGSFLLLLSAIKTLWPLPSTFFKIHWLILLEKKMALGWSTIFNSMNVRFPSEYLQKFLFGCAWGLVPCGLVYSVLGLAFLSGSSLQGSQLMIAMGLGTLPNLLIISGGLGKLTTWMAQIGASKSLKVLTASIFLSSALFGFYQTFTLPSQFLKNGICFS